MDEPEYPGFFADDDPDDDFDEFVAWLDREEAAGRTPVPPGPGLDDSWPGSLFAQGAAADGLPPGPVLAELTEAAVRDVTRLSDDQLTGVMHAARRQQNREGWKKVLVIAEFARRRADELADAEAHGAPVHRRPGQFPGEELAIELLLGPVQTSHVIDDAADLVTRLPATAAGMAAGLIDEDRAGVIALHTRSLSPADAATADAILASLAPGLRLDQLARKAAALEMKLAPEAVKARREHARRTLQRVEVRREESGNASVAGREMDTGDALAAKAHIHSFALQLRRAGLPGTLDQLRLAVFADLTAGRDPLGRLLRRPAHPGEPTAGSPANAGEPPRTGPAHAGASAGAGSAGPRDRLASNPAGLDYDHDETDREGEEPDPAPPGPAPGPVPAMINLIVQGGTLFGWDTTPADAGGWGLLDGEETRDLVAAASRHPATRWCVTVTGPDGTAVAHGCSAGRHQWSPGPGQATQPSTGPPDPPGPPQDHPASRQQHLVRFLSSLNVTLRPVAKDNCDHACAEPRYTPSRALTHLVRARTVTCDAPGCAAQAVHADLDHTVPYPGGLTDQCNLGPKCRRHHRVKQAPGWTVEQPRPGIIRWTLPNGRTHTTRPTVYGFATTLPSPGAEPQRLEHPAGVDRR